MIWVYKENIAKKLCFCIFVNKVNLMTLLAVHHVMELGETTCVTTHMSSIVPYLENSYKHCDARSSGGCPWRCGIKSR
jgi:hypothetical protein